VLDDLSRGRLSNLADAGDRVRFIRGDVVDPGLAAVVADVAPEVIFHLAAQIDVRASIADPAKDAMINVVGTIAIAEAARSAGVRKIVFTSSGGSIYGHSQVLPTPETAPLQPLSPYAAAKAAAELYLDSFSRTHGLQCTHVALANVYGPRQSPDGEAGVVAIFANSMLHGLPTKVFGDGGNTRDYVFVDDVTSALVLASADRGDRQRFNIGTGRQVSDRELHSLVAAEVGSPDQPAFAPERRGEVRHCALDSSLAADTLGWRPEVSMTAGIARTVAYLRAIR
jgi:UDP-glucose 4-epimerase